MSSKQEPKSESKIAVIGERELVIGYRLLGIDDTFIVSGGNESYKKMENIFSSKEFTIIIASKSVRDSLPPVFRTKVEESIEPLVLFMPSLDGTIQEESLSALAKRVLGVSLG